MKLSEQAKADLVWALDNLRRAWKLYEWGRYRWQKYKQPFESGYCQAAYDHYVKTCKKHNIKPGTTQDVHPC